MGRARPRARRAVHRDFLLEYRFPERSGLPGQSRHSGAPGPSSRRFDLLGTPHRGAHDTVAEHQHLHLGDCRRRHFGDARGHLRPVLAPGHAARHDHRDPDGVGHLRHTWRGGEIVVPLLRTAGVVRLRPVLCPTARHHWPARLRRRSCPADGNSLPGGDLADRTDLGTSHRTVGDAVVQRPVMHPRRGRLGRPRSLRVSHPGIVGAVGSRLSSTHESRADVGHRLSAHPVVVEPVPPAAGDHDLEVTHPAGVMVHRRRLRARRVKAPTGGIGAGAATALRAHRRRRRSPASRG